MLVIFLVGAVSMVLLRALKKDFERIAAEEESDLEYEKVIEETGWKKVGHFFYFFLKGYKSHKKIHLFF